MSKAVLVVEDEYLIAMDIQRLLVSQGWQVIGPAGSVRQAMLLIEQALPVAAILDVNLGGDLVTPVAEALAARGIPFAVASAIDSPERLGGEVLAGAPMQASRLPSGDCAQLWQRCWGHSIPGQRIFEIPRGYLPDLTCYMENRATLPL